MKDKRKRFVMDPRTDVRIRMDEEQRTFYSLLLEQEAKEAWTGWESARLKRIRIRLGRPDKDGYVSLSRPQLSILLNLLPKTVEMYPYGRTLSIDDEKPWNRYPSGYEKPKVYPLGEYADYPKEARAVLREFPDLQERLTKKPGRVTDMLLSSALETDYYRSKLPDRHRLSLGVRRIASEREHKRKLQESKRLAKSLTREELMKQASDKIEGVSGYRKDMALRKLRSYTKSELAYVIPHLKVDTYGWVSGISKPQAKQPTKQEE